MAADASDKPIPAPAALQKILTTAHTRSATLPPMAHALATGLLTTLLPCGWLYAFVALAAGTASAPLGALVMLTFWIGTLPAIAAFWIPVALLAGVFIGAFIHYGKGPRPRA